MVRETMRIPQSDGTVKIVFRDSNQKTENPEQKNESKNGYKNKDNNQKSSDPDKMRYYNPIHPEHPDIFGHDLIGKPIIITVITGESIKCSMTG